VNITFDQRTEGDGKNGTITNFCDVRVPDDTFLFSNQ
jgi:hypothetical protein